MLHTKKWGLRALLLAAVIAAWYIWLVPKVSLDRTTPSVQNGLRLKAFYLRAKGNARYIDAYVETLPEARPQREKSPPIEFQIVEHPSRRFFVETFPHPQRYNNAYRVGIWLNHPPTVQRLTLEARWGDRTARWRLNLPRSMQVVEPQRAYDEWVHHPEVSARLGVYATVDSEGGAILDAGLRELTIRTQEPYLWKFSIHTVIPEWLTPVLGGESPAQIASDSKRERSGLALIFTSVDAFAASGASSQPLVCALGLMKLPFAESYRVCRVVGSFRKYESYEETIDLTGVPVEIHRDSRNNAYLLPLRHMEWTTPSGLRVRWVRRDYERAPPNEEGFLVGQLRIENWDSAAQASPLAQKYRRKAGVRIISEHKKDYLIRPLLGGRSPSMPVWVYVRPQRVGNEWRLPPVQLRFQYTTPVGMPIEFDRVLPVQVRRLGESSQAQSLSVNRSDSPDMLR